CPPISPARSPPSARRAAPNAGSQRNGAAASTWPTAPSAGSGARSSAQASSSDRAARRAAPRPRTPVSPKQSASRSRSNAWTGPSLPGLATRPPSRPSALTLAPVQPSGRCHPGPCRCASKAEPCNTTASRWRSERVAASSGAPGTGRRVEWTGCTANFLESEKSREDYHHTPDKGPGVGKNGGDPCETGLIWAALPRIAAWGLRFGGQRIEIAPELGVRLRDHAGLGDRHPRAPEADEREAHCDPVVVERIDRHRVGRQIPAPGPDPFDLQTVG